MKYLLSFLLQSILVALSFFRSTSDVFGFFRYYKSTLLVYAEKNVQNKRQKRRASFMKETVLFEDSNSISQEIIDDDIVREKVKELTITFPAAISFDIDGVLMRGKTGLPGAGEALKLCEKYNIPYVFLTNGGGMLEEVRIAQLDSSLGFSSSKVDLLHYDHFKRYLTNPNVLKDNELKDMSQFYLENDVSANKSKEVEEMERKQEIDGNPFFEAFAAERMILCHTPMKGLVPKYGEKLVLAFGNREFRKVLKEYGFQHVYTPSDIVQVWPDIYAHFDRAGEDDPISPSLKQKLLTRAYNQQFNRDGTEDIEFDPKTMPMPRIIVKPDVIFAIHDPMDWHLEIIVLMDSLYPDAHEFRDGTRKAQVPLYASQVDLVFSSNYPHPGLSPGTFFIALEAINKRIHSRQLHVKKFGKPYRRAYKACEMTLQKIARKILERNLLASPYIHHIVNSYVQDANLEEENDKFDLLLNKELLSLLPKSQHFYSFLKSLKSTSLLTFIFDGTNVFTKFVKQEASDYRKVDMNLNKDKLKSLVATKRLISENIDTKISIRFDNIYMIGDNPAADVRTAVNAKGPWKSILVKTGVWKPTGEETNDAEYPADYVVDGVLDAIQLVIKNHSLRPISEM